MTPAGIVSLVGPARLSETPQQHEQAEPHHSLEEKIESALQQRKGVVSSLGSPSSLVGASPLVHPVAPLERILQRVFPGIPYTSVDVRKEMDAYWSETKKLSRIELQALVENLSPQLFDEVLEDLERRWKEAFAIVLPGAFASLPYAHRVSFNTNDLNRSLCIPIRIRRDWDGLLARPSMQKEKFDACISRFARDLYLLSQYVFEYIKNRPCSPDGGTLQEVIESLISLDPSFLQRVEKSLKIPTMRDWALDPFSLLSIQKLLEKYRTLFPSSPSLQPVLQRTTVTLIQVVHEVFIAIRGYLLGERGAFICREDHINAFCQVAKRVAPALLTEISGSISSTLTKLCSESDIHGFLQRDYLAQVRLVSSEAFSNLVKTIPEWQTVTQELKERTDELQRKLEGWCIHYTTQGNALSCPEVLKVKQWMEEVGTFSLTSYRPAMEKLFFARLEALFSEKTVPALLCDGRSLSECASFSSFFYDPSYRFKIDKKMAEGEALAEEVLSNSSLVFSKKELMELGTFVVSGPRVTTSSFLSLIFTRSMALEQTSLRTIQSPADIGVYYQKMLSVKAEYDALFSLLANSILWNGVFCTQLTLFAQRLNEVYLESGSDPLLQTAIADFVLRLLQECEVATDVIKFLHKLHCLRALSSCVLSHRNLSGQMVVNRPVASPKIVQALPLFSFLHYEGGSIHPQTIIKNIEILTTLRFLFHPMSTEPGFNKIVGSAVEKMTEGLVDDVVQLLRNLWSYSCEGILIERMMRHLIAFDETLLERALTQVFASRFVTYTNEPRSLCDRLRQLVFEEAQYTNLLSTFPEELSFCRKHFAAERVAFKEAVLKLFSSYGINDFSQPSLQEDLKLLLQGIKDEYVELFDCVVDAVWISITILHDAVSSQDPLTLSIEYLTRGLHDLQRIEAGWMKALLSLSGVKQQQVASSLCTFIQNIKARCQIVFHLYSEGKRVLSVEEIRSFHNILEKSFPEEFGLFQRAIQARIDRMGKKEDRESLELDLLEISRLRAVFSHQRVASVQQELLVLLLRKVDKSSTREELQEWVRLLSMAYPTIKFLPNLLLKISSIEGMDGVFFSRTMGEWQEKVRRLGECIKSYTGFSERPEIQKALERFFDTQGHALAEDLVARYRVNPQETAVFMEKATQALSLTKPIELALFLLMRKQIREGYADVFLSLFPAQGAFFEAMKQDLRALFRRVTCGEERLIFHEALRYADIFALIEPSSFDTLNEVSNHFIAAEIVRKEKPFSALSLLAYAKAAEMVRFDTRHPMYDLEKTLAHGEHKACIERAGTYFPSLGTGAIKAGTLHVSKKKIVDSVSKSLRECISFDFRISHWMRQLVAQNLKALVSRPEIIQQLLPQGFCLSARVIEKVPTIIRQYDESRQAYLDEIGLRLGKETQIIFDGVGVLRISTDPDFYSMYNRIILELAPSVVPGELVTRAHTVLSLLGLVEILVPRSQEDEKRLKILTLVHTFLPRLAYGLERERDTYIMATEALIQKIVASDSSIEPIFQKYLVDHPELLIKVPTVVNQNASYYLVDMGELLQKRDLIGFMAGMGDDYFKQLDWTNNPTQAKARSVEWFRSYIQKAWKKGTGVALSSNAIRYLDQGSLRDGTSVVHDALMGGLDGVFAHPVSKRFLDPSFTMRSMMFSTFGVRLILSPYVAGYTSYVHSCDCYGGRSLLRQAGGERYDERDSFLEFAEKLRDKSKEFEETLRSNERVRDPVFSSSEAVFRDAIGLQHIRSIVVPRQEMKEALLQVLTEEGFIHSNTLTLGGLTKPVSECIFVDDCFKEEMFTPWREEKTKVLSLPDPLDHWREHRACLLKQTVQELFHSAEIEQLIQKKVLLNPQGNSAIFDSLKQEIGKKSLVEQESLFEPYRKHILALHTELVNKHFSQQGVEFSGQVSLNRQLVFILARFQRNNHLSYADLIRALLAGSSLNELPFFTDQPSTTIVRRLEYALNEIHPVVLAGLPFNVYKAPYEGASLDKEYEALIEQSRATKETLFALYEAYERMTSQKAYRITPPSFFETHQGESCLSLFQHVLSKIEEKQQSHGERIYSLAAHFTLKDLKDQIQRGFLRLLALLAQEKNVPLTVYRDQLNPEEFVSALSTSTVGIDAWVSHLFWDRLHLQVGLGKAEEILLPIGKQQLSYREVIHQVSLYLDRPSVNPLETVVARQQLKIRFLMILEFLDKVIVPI